MTSKRHESIDFPCAPTWATHYARQGLTSDYLSEHYARDVEWETRERLARALDRIAEMQLKLVVLDNQNEALRDEVEALREQLSWRDRASKAAAKKNPDRIPTVRGIEL